jgi:hypothetical protein
MSQGESPSSIDADSVSTFMVLQWNGFWIMGPHGLQKMGLSCALGWIGKKLLFHWDLRNCMSRKPEIVDLVDIGAF